MSKKAGVGLKEKSTAHFHNILPRATCYSTADDSIPGDEDFEDTSV